MAVLIEKGIHALVFAALFMTLATTLEALTPADPAEIYELHSTYVFGLRIVALVFAAIFGILVIVGALSKINPVKRMAGVMAARHVALGYVISGLGLLSVFYFLSEFMVTPC